MFSKQRADSRADTRSLHTSSFAMRIAILQLVFFNVIAGEPHSSFQVYGANTSNDNLEKLGVMLISELQYPKITKAMKTLHVTNTSSFHLFANNHTEPCHTHPGLTVSRVIQGHGAFRVPYGKKVLQNPGDEFVIPIGQPHSFGPEDDSSGPVVVLVVWSPPYHENYTIPASGCIMD
jgi:mannose-6-phosphate isomerase-like protein (cupin superfamily)